MLFDSVDVIFELSKLLLEKVCVASVDCVDESLAHWLQRYGLSHNLRNSVKIALASIKTDTEHFKQERHDEASYHVDD